MNDPVRWGDDDDDDGEMMMMMMVVVKGASVSVQVNFLRCTRGV